MATKKKPGRQGNTSNKRRKTSAPVSAELLLEIGVEELPYQFVAPALAALKESADRLLKEQRLACDGVRTLGTPRRLTLIVAGLAAKQTSVTKETMGPSKAVAFDQAGQPTKAAVGFAAGQGIAVHDLQVRQTPKGDYLFAIKREEGRQAGSVLIDVLPYLVSGLTFPKAMKWNETGVRFARPVRWVLALYGGAVVPMQVAGINASHHTTGHRVLGGGTWVAVRDSASYMRTLERLGVIVDPERRREVIEEQITAICRKTGFNLIDDEALLDQAVYTTECPVAIIGSFKEACLDMPQDILITSMKEHQGFFSLRQKDSRKLAPHFIAVTNNRVKDMSLIREGNERVLAARLADAKFFFDEDRKVGLRERAKKLAGVTFHRKLGTMEQKQERVKKLAGWIATHLCPDQHELQQVCDRAASLSKADLLTGIVGEFPELQGVMGGEYAVYEGESLAVGRAIREQYLPKALEGDVPETLAGQILSLADRLDSIAAFFHVGIIPTGSEDPFALRRHATAMVRIILESNLRMDLSGLITHARGLVAVDGFKGLPDAEAEGGRRITEFLLERVRHYCRVVYLLRDDLMDAVIKPVRDRSLDPVDLVMRMKALERVTTTPEFESLIIGFKRVHRLVEKEQWMREPVDAATFQHEAESGLYRAVTDQCGKVEGFVGTGEYGLALEALVSLRPAIDEFFTAVMVNVDDKAVRSNRLSLLKDVDQLFMSFADLSQIVVQGS